jgi:hypothetical protein
MKVWLGKDTQTKLAAEGLFIPAVKGTADAIQDPLMKSVAQEVDKSQWIAIAMDQLLGPTPAECSMMRARTLPRATRHRKKLLKQSKTPGKQNKAQ